MLISILVYQYEFFVKYLLQYFSHCVVGITYNCEIVFQYHHLMQLHLQFRLLRQPTWGLPLEGLVSPILTERLLIWLRTINQPLLTHSLVNI